MISTVYGFPIYKVQVDSKSLMLKEASLNMDKIGDLSVWEANCLTTSTKDYEDAFNSGYVKDEVTKYANEMMKELAIDLSLSLKICETKDCTTCDDIWMNVYNKGHSQETHLHLLDIPDRRQPLFSFSYFVKYNPEVDAKFIFVNPNTNIDFKELYIQEIPMDVNEGDILIFPSFLLHRVEEQKANQQRITISGNFYEELKEEIVF